MQRLHLSFLLASGLLALPQTATATKFRVLVAYTPAAESAMPTTLRDFIEDYVIDLTNTAYANSPSSGQTMPEIELAGITKVAYTEAGSGSHAAMQTDLYYLRTNGDGQMDGLHHLRSIYAADVVALVFQGYSGSVSCAVGTHCTGPNDGIGANAAYAFYVAKPYPYFAQNVHAHEIGHLFGCRHAIESPHPNPGSSTPAGFDPHNLPYSYGHGYFDTIPGSPNTYFGDIMGSPSSYRQQWFSNPNLNYISGYPRGNATYANCALVLHDQKTLFAAFRSPVPNAVMQNQTVGNQQYADVGGTNVSTSGSVIFQAGSEGKMRATGNVSINPGFRLEPGAKLSITTGSGALAKKALRGHDQTEGEGISQSLPEAFSAHVTLNRNGALLKYTLPEPASISVRVLSITGREVYKRNLGWRSPGQFQETIGFSPQETGVYFVQLRAGKNIVTRKTHWAK